VQPPARACLNPAWHKCPAKFPRLAVPCHGWKTSGLLKKTMMKYYNIYNIIYFYIIYIYVENCESMKWRRLLSDRSNGNVHSYPFIDHFPVEHGWVAAATVDESLIWARNQGNLVDESGRYTPVPAPNSPGLT
jgi:hypothetical protein